MADTWITDLTHFLADDRSIAPPSGPARRLAEYLGAIVAEITAEIGEQPRFDKVRCRRRPGRKPCSGRIESDIDLNDLESMVIIWRCPVCGDNGTIRNWEGTLWDCSEPQETH